MKGKERWEKCLKTAIGLKMAREDLF